MAEADPMRTLASSSGLRLSKRTRGPSAATVPILLKSGGAAVTPPSDSFTEIAMAAPKLDVSDETKEQIIPLVPETPAPAQAPPDRASSEDTPAATSLTSTGSTNLRRKAKLTDVARIVEPSQTNGAESLLSPEPSSTVVPPAFSVPTDTQVTEKKAEVPPVPAAPEVPPAVGSSSIGATQTEPPKKPMPLERLGPTASSPDKREFHLTNGERIVGKVLSETTDSIYIDHATLGVLTLARSQIAERMIEIILINGDRIVGDIMAETPDTLYVRHASLGMLTVPRAQRSTRVVEAILKNGDRILGEVVTETETVTIIRSATLGTITVPHDQVAMLNRKVEQIALKALPPSPPELKDKPKE